MTRHILVTNDDGIEADALVPLAAALTPLGEVHVIAPERNWSGAGHSITLFRPLRCKETRLADGREAFVTDGSPTDCVRLAVLGFLHTKPDLIVSGVNRGSNVGDDITYSGTVAAAMEGILSNIPSIAISLASFSADADFGPASDFAALLAANILERGFSPDALLNVNVPGVPRDEIAGVEVTRLGKSNYRDMLVERLDPFGVPYYWLGGPAVDAAAEPGTDLHAIRRNMISVTPIHLDLSSHALIGELARWDWGWSAPKGLPRA